MPSQHCVAQSPSQVSPGSTTPFPQVAVIQILSSVSLRDRQYELPSQSVCRLHASRSMQPCAVVPPASAIKSLQYKLASQSVCAPHSLPESVSRNNEQPEFKRNTRQSNTRGTHVYFIADDTLCPLVSSFGAGIRLGKRNQPSAKEILADLDRSIEQDRSTFCSPVPRTQSPQPRKPLG